LLPDCAPLNGVYKSQGNPETPSGTTGLKMACSQDVMIVGISQFGSNGIAVSPLMTQEKCHISPFGYFETVFYRGFQSKSPVVTDRCFASHIRCICRIAVPV